MMNSKLTEKEVLNFMLSNENVYGTINRYATIPEMFMIPSLMHLENWKKRFIQMLKIF